MFTKLQWQKKYGEARTAFASFVEQTVDGGYFIVGNAEIRDYNILELNGSNISVLKINSQGKVEWEKVLGTNFNDVIVVDQNDEVIAAGVAAHEGEELAWLFKLDANGALKWNTYYNGPVGKSRFKGLIIAKDGHIVTAGTSDSKEGLEAPYENNQIWILKLR